MSRVIDLRHWSGLAIGILIGGLVVLSVQQLARTPMEKKASQTAANTTQNPPTSPTSDNPNPPSCNTSPNFPASVPIYTPSQQVSSNGNAATYSSPSPDYTVLNFYGEMLSINGWKILTESTTNSATIINAQGNGLTISVSISSGGQNGSTFTVQRS